MPENERERKLQEICSAALKRGASLRTDFLRQACGDDAKLRHEAESLLGYAEKLDGFLETPALSKVGLVGATDEGGSLVGQTLGPYSVLSLLGAGGMGEVYWARDTRLGRLVALKTLHPDVAADPERKRRLLLEAQAASALNDPHIVALYDMGSADGTDFLVMEYVPGETLDKVIARGGLEVQQALAYATAIADALARAHKAGDHPSGPEAGQHHGDR
jgi:serine/threonine protein kinase